MLPAGKFRELLAVDDLATSEASVGDIHESASRKSRIEPEAE